MFTLVMMLNDKQMSLNEKQDGRLAPAYFLPNYKHFDELLQTVKNKTTVLILVFKEFLQTSMPQLISVVSAKGYYDFPLKNLLSHSTEKFRRGTLLCFTKFRYRKILRIRGGLLQFSAEFFSSHSAKSFRRGILQCFINFGYRKVLCIGGGIKVLSNFFCLRGPKNFVGEPFCVSQNFGYRKMLGVREGQVSRISVKFLLSHSAAKIRRGTLLCYLRKFPVAKKFTDKKRAEYQDFPSGIFCLTVPKIS